MNTIEKFPRLCDVKMVGIRSGYVFLDYNLTCEDESDALAKALELGYKNLEEAYNSDVYYYTEWEEIGEEWYECHDGVWFECTATEKNPVQ